MTVFERKSPKLGRERREMDSTLGENMESQTRLWAAALSLISFAACQRPLFAAWPFADESGCRRGSAEYYNGRANDPVGQRQRCKYGVTWPPQPRPCGPEMTCVHKYYHVRNWPYPYTCEDRSVVQMTCQGQIANGWAAETTFYDYHFDPYTNELNSSGLGKLVWILNAAPVQFRQAYVAPSDLSEAISEARVAQIQKEAQRMSQSSLEVSLRNSLSDGRPAYEVEAIFDSLRKEPIPPKIDEGSNDTAASGTSDPPRSAYRSTP